MNQLSYYVTKRLIVGSKDSSGTIINDIHLLKLCYAIGCFDSLVLHVDAMVHSLGLWCILNIC